MRKSKIMKALLVFGMSVVTATAMVGFTACDSNAGEGGGEGTGGEGGGGGGGGSTCQHVYTGEYNGYNGNATQHWHTCDTCDAEADRADHVDGDDADKNCDVCGYEIEHSFNESAWKKDANGHWYEATCQHTTEKGSYAAHVDDNAPYGECDVCGYTDETPAEYKALLAKTTGDAPTAQLLYNNSFLIGGKKLPEFTSWGTAGAYTYYDKADTPRESNYVQVTDGKATQVTTKVGNIATVVDFGTVSIGTIEGYVDFTPSAVGSKWNIVSFHNGGGLGDSGIAFSLRVGSDKKTLQYTINNQVDSAGNGQALDATYELAEKLTYNLQYSLNLVDGSVTAKIKKSTDTEYTTILNNKEVGLTGVTGLRVVSGSSGERLVTVDNVIAVYTAADVSGLKTGTKAQVSAIDTKAQANALEGNTWSLSTTASALSSAKETADAAIDAVTAETANASQVINDAKSTYETAVKTALSAEYKDRLEKKFVSTDYDRDDETVAAYNTRITEGKALFDAVSAVDGYAKAWTNAVAKFDDLKNDTRAELAEITVTINNEEGTKVGEILKVEENTVITVADLKAAVTVPGGKTISGIYLEDKTTEVTADVTAGKTNLVYVVKFADVSAYEVSFVDKKITASDNYDVSGWTVGSYNGDTIGYLDAEGTQEIKGGVKLNSSGTAKFTLAGTTGSDVKVTFYITVRKAGDSKGKLAGQSLKFTAGSSTITTEDADAVELYKTATTAGGNDDLACYSIEVTLKAGTEYTVARGGSKELVLHKMVIG